MNSDARDLLEEGNQLANAGQHRAAIEAFLRAESAGVPGASLNLGNSYKALGDLDRATAAFRRGWVGGDDDAGLNLAYALEEAGDRDEARDVLRDLTDSGYDKARMNLAGLVWEDGDFAAAERILEPALDAAEEEVARCAHGMLGTWRWLRTKDPAVRPLLERGQDAYPSARADLAELLDELGQHDEAMSVLQRGADADEAESMIPLGNHYWEAEQYDLAIATFRRAAEMGEALRTTSDYCTLSSATWLMLSGGSRAELSWAIHSRARGSATTMYGLRKGPDIKAPRNVMLCCQSAHNRHP